MPDLSKRLLGAIVAAVMTLAVVACSDDSSPTDPDDPDSTQPVGS